MVKRVKVSDEPRKVIDLDLMADIPKEWREELERKVWKSMIDDGASSRAIGLPADHISMRLLRDPDMAASWRMGWHREDERLKKVKRK
jgi:hypothetical protein